MSFICHGLSMLLLWCLINNKSQQHSSVILSVVKIAVTNLNSLVGIT